MDKIVIIGKGNVGSHLTNAFHVNGFDVRNISSRSECFDLSDVDIVIISVHDDAIGAIASKVADALGNQSKPYPIVVHTSGSISLNILKDTLPEQTPLGVFYPMQTFSKEVEMRYDNIPFLIEGSDSETLSRLMKIAGKISPNVSAADSKIRKDYHIGAVFACNFANHLWALADKYLEAKGLSFYMLRPLLEQTISKISATRPFDSQTGPAVRGDKNVISNHLAQLKSDPELSNIYEILSQSIETLHNNPNK